MRVTWKISAIILLLAMLALSASCSGVSRQVAVSDPEAEDRVELTFMSPWGGSSAYRDLIEETIERFMSENPDVTINNDSLSSEEYLEKLKTNIVSGYIPDVFYLWPGYDLNALILADQVANIYDLMLYDEDWEHTFSPFALQNNRYNRYLCGLPFETCFAAMYVNVDILDDHGIEIPRTYEELKQASVILNRSGIIPIAYSASNAGSLLYQCIVVSLSDHDTSLQYPAGGKNDESYVSAMNIMRELYWMNAFPKNCFTLSGHEQDRLFLSGKAAMVAEGSWFSGYIGQMDDDVRIIPFPDIDQSDDGYNLICVNGYGSLHISSNAFDNPRTKDACIRFLKYFTSAEVAQRFISEKGMISALNLSPYAYEGNVHAKQGIDIIRNSKEIYKFPYELFGENIWNDVFISQFPYMLENRITPEEVFDEALRRKH